MPIQSTTKRASSNQKPILHLAHIQLKQMQDLALQSVIRHLLLIQAKEDADQAKINATFNQLANLKSRISDIDRSNMGQSKSRKTKQNFCDAGVVTFSNFVARDDYLIHPEHKDLERVLLNLLADLVVFDVEC